MGNRKDKFEFGEDFQELLLRYTAKDRDGYKALLLYEDYYFTLLEHQIIAKAFKRYFKKNKRIPADPIILKEELRKLFLTRDYVNLLSEGDKKLIGKIVDSIYKKPVRDGEILLDSCKKFASFVELKKIFEDSDITNYSEYISIHKKIHNAINIGQEKEESMGQYLVEGARLRHVERKALDEIYPTPFWQLNRLSNSGKGYELASVFCLLGPDKFFKTGGLINIALGYLKKKKKVLYVDLENGEKTLITRVEQALIGKSKKEILSGQYDKKIQKKLRKYRILGGELVIKRMPSYVTTKDDIQRFLDDTYNQHGIRFDGIIVDYLGIAGSTTRKDDDFGRISDAYLDFKNLLSDNNFEFGWTGHHIKKEAVKRIASRYRSEDVAKCIDIPRHLDALIGLNQNSQEKAEDILRLEVVVQRDGVPEGRCYFKMERSTQRLLEMTRDQVKNISKHEQSLYTEDEINEMRNQSSDI